MTDLATARGDTDFSEIAMSILLEVDCVARIGGEEFVLVLGGTPQKDAVIAVQRIAEQLERTASRFNRAQLSHYCINGHHRNTNPVKMWNKAWIERTRRSTMQKDRSKQDRLIAEVIKRFSFRPMAKAKNLRE